MIHICFQNLEMNKRLAYWGISTELYNKSLVYSYTKFIGNFEETVRLSFNPINHVPTGEYIVGSRCSAITPWKHGRVLVLKGEGSDPYDASQQKYQVIDDGLTYSTPTRTSGSGTGLINIELLSNATTRGYEIWFTSDTSCSLYSGGSMIDDSQLLQGEWNLVVEDRISIEIMNDDSNPYLINNNLWFSTLNDIEIFDKIKVE